MRPSHPTEKIPAKFSNGIQHNSPRFPRSSSREGDVLCDIRNTQKPDLENQMLGAAVERRMLARRYRYLFWGGEYGKEIVLNSRMGIIRGGNGLTRDSGQEETSERREQSE